MIIPKEIKIGGFKVIVNLVDNLISDRDSYGEYSPRTQEIRIDKTNTRQLQEETFLHEVMEAITSIYAIDITHKDLSIIATVLHQIITDNKLI